MPQTTTRAAMIAKMIRKSLTSEDKTLFISSMKLKELPPLPEGIKTLFCCRNRLTFLPENLPSSLETIVCSNNKIRFLPLLCHFKNLKYLDVESNCLTSLPPLPESITTLYCSNNLFTTITDFFSDSQLSKIQNKELFFSCRSEYLAIQRSEIESFGEYFERLRIKEQKISAERIMSRTVIIKEELIATIWDPIRIEALLQKGLQLEEILGHN